MPRYTITLEQEETQLIYQTFDQIPLQGPNAKAVASNLQRKLQMAQPDIEPEPTEEEN